MLSPDAPVGIFATYFPDLYQEYAQTLGSLYDDNPLLRPLFQGSPWPALSINFPPHAYTRIHTDAGNKANGLCSIFSLGTFDPTKGGHLVLPDLKLLIEFPPGALILIPSASLRHGNIPVRDWEARASWTQYAAGGLFRWVEYGFCSWDSLKARSKELADAEVTRRSSRWTQALQSFPTVDDLKRRSIFM